MDDQVQACITKLSAKVRFTYNRKLVEDVRTASRVDQLVECTDVYCCWNLTQMLRTVDQ